MQTELSAVDPYAIDFFSLGIRSVYVAGPMRGYKEFNFPAFLSLGAYLRKCGLIVWNPAEHDLELQPNIREFPAYWNGDEVGIAGFNFQSVMHWDLSRVLETDAVVFLPGWEKSTGAKYERATAEATGKTVLLALPATDGRWYLSRDKTVRVVLSV